MQPGINHSIKWIGVIFLIIKIWKLLMARRKQLQGVAGNLVQWCLSRNFDYEGYWAPGQFYAYAEANGTDEVEFHLMEQFVPIHVEAIKFSSAIQLLSRILKRELDSNKIPDVWLRDVIITFKFNTVYQHEYHLWASALGGRPFMCKVEITTDLGKIYKKESGCNVWVHNPIKEQRRYGF